MYKYEYQLSCYHRIGSASLGSDVRCPSLFIYNLPSQTLRLSNRDACRQSRDPSIWQHLLQSAFVGAKNKISTEPARAGIKRETFAPSKS